MKSSWFAISHGVINRSKDFFFFSTSHILPSLAPLDEIRMQSYTSKDETVKYQNALISARLKTKGDMFSTSGRILDDSTMVKRTDCRHREDKVSTRVILSGNRECSQYSSMFIYKLFLKITLEWRLWRHLNTHPSQVSMFFLLLQLDYFNDSKWCLSTYQRMYLVITTTCHHLLIKWLGGKM